MHRNNRFVSFSSLLKRCNPPTSPPTGPDRTNVHHLYDRFSYFLHPTFPLWKVAIFLRKECLLNRETWNLRPLQYYLRNIGDKNASSIICESHSTTILVTFPIWSENCHLATKCKAEILQGIARTGRQCTHTVFIQSREGLCFSTKTNHFDAGGWSLNSSIFQYWPMEVEVDIFNIVVRRVVFVCVFVFDIFNIVVGVRRVGCSNTRVGKLALVKWGRKSNSMPRGDRGKTFREFLIYLAFPQRALAVEMSTERNQ